LQHPDRPFRFPQQFRIDPQLPFFPELYQTNLTMRHFSNGKEPMRPASVASALRGLVITTVVGMPLGRYFIFIGSMLMALLFLADNYFPPLTAAAARADVDRTVIRLHSRHKWPERIVIDTSLPTIVPPPVKIAEAAPVNETVLAKSATDARPVREALALATPIQEAAPAMMRKPAPKRRIRTARTYGTPRSGYVASYQPRGLGGPFSWDW
jgi:hypothetical protein